MNHNIPQYDFYKHKYGDELLIDVVPLNTIKKYLKTSQDPPRRFFGGNSFYTTSANRMSRHLFAEAVTCQDVITLCAMNLTANSSGPESGAPSSLPPSSFC